LSYGWFDAFYLQHDKSQAAERQKIAEVHDLLEIKTFQVSQLNPEQNGPKNEQNQ